MSSILIVDDEEGMRKTELRLFKRDYEVYSAEDGISAFNRFQRYNPDVVLTDVEMPFMHGINLCRKIKEQSLNTIVICMSGEAAYREQALEAGADAFFEKPFENSNLVDKVKELLGKTIPLS